MALLAALALGLPGKLNKPEPVVQPTQLPPHGGPLTAGTFDSSCYVTDRTICDGNGFSVLGVDVRRSRFLVVWIESLTGADDVGGNDKLMARFISRVGRIGPKVKLSGQLRDGEVSVAYQSFNDRFVVSWNGFDQFLSPTSLAVVAPRRRSSWHADNITAARDRNVRIWGHERGQLGRIPSTGVGLAIWDANSFQVEGQILPPGRTPSVS